jgi:hypothetical protein
MPLLIPPVNLRNLALQAFGRSPLGRFQLPHDFEVEQHFDVPIDAPEPPHRDGTGLLGLPRFANATFYGVAAVPKPEAGTKPVADAATQQPRGPALLTLADPIVQVSRETVIVSTSIQGRSGQVKEYIGNGDFTISFKGVLASPVDDGRVARNYPTTQVEALRNMCTDGKTLEVVCYLLQPLGIKNVVVKKLSLPPMTGYTNLQAYELECVSDDPIELSL